MGVDRFSQTEAAALKTGTDELPVESDKSAYKPAYKKLAKNAYSDNNAVASDVAMQEVGVVKSSSFDMSYTSLSNEQLGFF